MNRLKGKRALITGGTSGIGLETARLFLAEGARIIVTGAGDKSVASAAKQLASAEAVLASDAGNAEEQKKLAQTVKEKLGELDILFCNAGVADLRPLEAWDEAGLQRTFDINFTGPFFLVQALLPFFANPASIILGASVNARIGMPGTSIYGASKAALLSLVRTLSGELISRGIRVNAVSPGPIETPLYDKLGLKGADLDTAKKALTGKVPAGRFGRASEVAETVVFLASDEAPFIVGTEIQIDGGMGNV